MRKPRLLLALALAAEIVAAGVVASGVFPSISEAAPVSGASIVVCIVQQVEEEGMTGHSPGTGCHSALQSESVEWSDLPPAPGGPSVEELAERIGAPRQRLQEVEVIEKEEFGTGQSRPPVLLPGEEALGTPAPFFEREGEEGATSAISFVPPPGSANPTRYPSRTRGGLELVLELDTGWIGVKKPECETTEGAKGTIVACPKPVVGVEIQPGFELQYRWSFGDGESSSEPEPKPHEYTAAGGPQSYEVSVEVTLVNAAGGVEAAGEALVVVPVKSEPRPDRPDGLGEDDSITPAAGGGSPPETAAPPGPTTETPATGGTPRAPTPAKHPSRTHAQSRAKPKRRAAPPVHGSPAPLAPGHGPGGGGRGEGGVGGGAGGGLGGGRGGGGLSDDGEADASIPSAPSSPTATHAPQASEAPSLAVPPRKEKPRTGSREDASAGAPLPRSHRGLEGVLLRASGASAAASAEGPQAVSPASSGSPARRLARQSAVPSTGPWGPAAAIAALLAILWGALRELLARHRLA